MIGYSIFPLSIFGGSGNISGIALRFSSGQEGTTSSYSDRKRKVVVVGAGGSGLVAALAAIQAKPDANITVLERNDTPGGVTSISTGIIRACESSLQKKAGLSGVTKQDAFKQHLEVGGNRQDLDMLERYVQSSGEAVNWLLSQGCQIEIFKDFQHMIKPWEDGLSGGSGMTEVLYRAAKKSGVKFRFNVRVTDLVVRDGKVVGVKAIDKNDKQVQFAGDAVILADGGFWGAGKGAFDKDIPAHLKDVIIAAEGSYSNCGSGDGARMAESIGADLQNMDALEYTAQRYLNKDGVLCPIYGSDTLWSQAASIILNRSLDRFLNEDLCYSKETLTDEISRELTKRHEKWFWNIWDEKSKENTYRIRYWIGKGFIEQGFILTGKTLDELAQQMGVNPEKLKAAVFEYNSYFEQGLEKDPRFGRDLKRERVHPFINPPFYAMRAGIQCNNRRGGISTDVETHALDNNKKPVPGLYVVGSSMNAVKFDGMGWLSGTGLTACVVWGRIAGKNAVLGR